MNKFDLKVRRFLVDEGYLFPTTDAEIERSIQEAKESGIEIPAHLDNANQFLIQYIPAALPAPDTANPIPKSAT